MKNIVIIGAGTAGKILASDVKNNYQNLNILGFIDDHSKTVSSYLGQISDLRVLINKFKIDELVIAIPSADGKLIRKIILQNINNRIPIRIVPRQQYTLAYNHARYEDVRDLTAEDFLGRAVDKRSLTLFKRIYRNKTALVTGGAGSIGSEIVKQLLDSGIKKVIIYDQSEYLCYQLEQQLIENKTNKKNYRIYLGDVTNTVKIKAIVAKQKPDLIFHVAAYKHVHLMQTNIDEAITTNVLGTKIVADAAIKNKVATFVFISTDKVVKPQSIMGASKLLAEHVILSMPPTLTKFSIVRFGNVINSNGSVLPLFDRQLSDHRYITLTSKKMYRFFMSIREAASLVLTSAAHPARNSIYVLNMGDLISISEVARCYIRSKNLIPGTDVTIKEIGTRPGEKLREQLFTVKERRQLFKTKYSNLWRLKADKPSAETMNQINMIIKDAQQNRLKSLHYKIKKMFPFTLA